MNGKLKGEIDMVEEQIIIIKWKNRKHPAEEIDKCLISDQFFIASIEIEELILNSNKKETVCPNCKATDGFKVMQFGNGIMISCKKCPDIKWTQIINFGKPTIDDRLGMRGVSYFSHNFKHFYGDGTKMAWEDAFRKAIDKTVDQLQSEEVHCPDCDCIAVGDGKQENYYCFNCENQFKKGRDD